MNIEPAVIRERYNRETLRKEVETILVGNTSQYLIDEWNRDPTPRRIKMSPLERWIVNEPLPPDELATMQSQVDSLRAHKIFLTIGEISSVIDEHVANDLRKIL